MTLQADTASDLMSPDPVSIRHDATLHEAIALMTDRDIRAAPVIDEAGRAVGVISQTDILVHDREHAAYLEPVGDFYTRSDLTVRGERLPGSFLIERPDTTTVAEVMSPAVFAVRPDTPAAAVVQKMLELHVHRLFVEDESGTLVGVISTSDLLRRLSL
jgi:CBS domain-containing protein